jgi:CRP/FNR family transcriptional regulator
MLQFFFNTKNSNTKVNIVQLKLKSLFLFQNLDDNTIAQIEKFTFMEKASQGTILFYEGNEAPYLYLLTSGIIKLYKISNTNKKLILKYFRPNELIGEVANFEEIPYPATAQAFIDVEYLKIDFSKLKDIIYKNPELSFKIQASLIKKIKNLEQLITSDIILDAKGRVAKYIFENEESFFTSKNTEISEMLNLTPETLSRILKTFKNQHLINIKDKTIDKDALSLYFL